ncbi:hypothetical protein OIU78_008792 [Salix suchowensis]|nr:hypothetical protein OIU78_008792 [Salix suchowensis]
MLSFVGDTAGRIRSTPQVSMHKDLSREGNWRAPPGCIWRIIAALLKTIVLANSSNRPVVIQLGGAFKFFMFPNCEYNSLFVLHPHTREHSSKVEWVKSLSEFKGNGSSMKESRGGLGLWTPYPADFKSVVLPKEARTSKAG